MKKILLLFVAAFLTIACKPSEDIGAEIIDEMEALSLSATFHHPSYTESDWVKYVNDYVDLFAKYISKTKCKNFDEDLVVNFMLLYFLSPLEDYYKGDVVELFDKAEKRMSPIKRIRYHRFLKKYDKSKE